MSEAALLLPGSSGKVFHKTGPALGVPRAPIFLIAMKPSGLHHLREDGERERLLHHDEVRCSE